MTQLIAPRILVLEGLYADTAEIVGDAGGIGIEASPWDWAQVERKLKSNEIDGLLLTGGTDVNPVRYGQKPCPVTQTPDLTRDFVELQALAYCREHKLPVLGICRGSQIMCVSRGGALCQDIQLYTDAWHGHSGTEHPVTPYGTTFRRAIGGAEEIKAISLHHQCVQYPGTGMRIAATAYDGTPEAIESKDGLMLGVQFHPEMTAYNDPAAFAIFRWLIETAARRAGGKAYAASFHEAVELNHDRLSRAWTAFDSDSKPGSNPGNYGSESDACAAWGYDGYEYSDHGDHGWVKGGTSSTSTGNSLLPARLPRKAGEPSIPSMRETTPSQREMVKLIEQSTGHQVTVIDAWGDVVDVVDGTCEEIALPTDTPRNGYLDDAAIDRIMSNLTICPTCAMEFDLIEDCDDHKKYVHPQDEDSQTWQQRFADMHKAL